MHCCKQHQIRDLVMPFTVHRLHGEVNHWSIIPDFAVNLTPVALHCLPTKMQSYLPLHHTQQYVPVVAIAQ